jgi:hypothetical protein
MLFPRLPLLEQVSRNLGEKPLLKHTVLVCVQHLLETTGSLIEQFFRMGLKPHRTYVLGKVYSTNTEVQSQLVRAKVRVIVPSPIRELGRYDELLAADVRRVWQFVQDTDDWADVQCVVVLDDGGFGVAGIPPGLNRTVPVIGIEQTMSGLSPDGKDPAATRLIEVASSAAKKYIEPPMICEAVLTKLVNRLGTILGESAVGVIGIGNIGGALAEGLLRTCRELCVYDHDSMRTGSLPGATFCRTAEELFDRCSIVFGCTGKDFLAGSFWWQGLQGRKVLISCSSQDREFASLLNFVDGNKVSDPMGDLSLPLRNGELVLVRGGFPANFDGSAESVPRIDIQMTRALLLGGVLQAVSPASPNDGGEMLAAEIQRFVVQQWLALAPHRAQWYSPHLLKRFSNLQWIEQNSGGLRPDWSGSQMSTLRKSHAFAAPAAAEE